MTAEHGQAHLALVAAVVAPGPLRGSSTPSPQPDLGIPPPSSSALCPACSSTPPSPSRRIRPSPRWIRSTTSLKPPCRRTRVHVVCGVEVARMWNRLRRRHLRAAPPLPHPGERRTKQLHAGLLFCCTISLRSHSVFVDSRGSLLICNFPRYINW